MSDVVDVVTIVDKDVAVAKVTVKVGHLTQEYTGSSKRHPKDQPDAVTGETLAVARALEKAAKEMQMAAEARVDVAANYQPFFSSPFFPSVAPPMIVDEWVSTPDERW